jgi:tRNA pseudouridine55 synthase
MNGILVIDKPAGPTSHDIVDRVRRVLGVRRVGHTGTLDPFATGVLPICVGKATRLVRFLAESDKAYRARVRFGWATTTDDGTGEPLSAAEPVTPERAALAAACRRFTGPLRQVPPAYSAKRVAGRRLYELARAGVAVAPSAVAVVVHRLELHELGDGWADLEVLCSAGTYVRALARDLGEALGTGAHLQALRRTSAAGFGLDHALAADSLTAERALAALLPLEAALGDVPALRVGAEGLAALRHGRPLTSPLLLDPLPAPPPSRARILDAEGRLVALAVPRGFDFAAPGLHVEPCFHPDVVLMD